MTTDTFYGAAVYDPSLLTAEELMRVLGLTKDHRIIVVPGKDAVITKVTDLDYIRKPSETKRP